MGNKYVKEDETFNTSRNGVVPKPSAAEVTAGKYLKADGTWATPSGGGGGSSTLAGLDDVALSNPSNGQVLKYNSTSSKWENANESGGSSYAYSTTEHVIGTWIDGKPVYEKTIDCGYLPNHATKSINHNISNLKRVIAHWGGAMNSSGVYLPLPKVSPSGLEYLVDIAVTDTIINIDTGNDRSGYYAYVTLQYTKTTD